MEFSADYSGFFGVPGDVTVEGAVNIKAVPDNIHPDSRDQYKPAIPKI